MPFTLGTIFLQEAIKFHWWASSIRPTLKLPARLWVVILIFATCVLALTIPIVILRSSESPHNEFADYVDFFPKSRLSTTFEKVFDCNTNATDGATYCSFNPQNSPFLYIGLTIKDEGISRIVFTPPPNMLKVGDLAVLWGRPEIQIAGHVAYLDWHSQKIWAIARADNGRFDYFSPVSNIAFY